VKRTGCQNSKSSSLNVRVLLSNSGRGLRTDAALIKGILEGYGCCVEVCVTPAWSANKTVLSHKYAKLKSFLPKFISRALEALQVRMLGLNKSNCDVQIHLESVSVEYLSCSKENWLIPNQEWVRPQHICFLKYISRILCKTKEAQSILQALHHNVELVGFSNPSVESLPQVVNDPGRMRQFLHVAGTNRKKGTRPIVAAWRKHPEWPRLHLVVDDASAFKPLPENITVWRRPDDATLTQLRMKCGVVLAPSEVEGYGHIFIEAMVFQQVVIATDAAPMNEVVQNDRGYLVSWKDSQPCHLGTRYFVGIADIEDIIMKVLKEPVGAFSEKAQNGRLWCVQNHRAFIGELTQRIDSVRGYELFSSILSKPSFTQQGGS